METLESNIKVMLKSVPYETGMAMSQPGIETKATDIVIIVTTVLIFAIFLMGLASVCYRWSYRQFNSNVSVNQFSDFDVESNTEARGIDADVLKSFPTFLYSEVKERKIGKGGVECAVCLSEFEDDETLRLIPNCCHVFHVDCLSVWLSDHSTCPLCRVDLVTSDPDPQRRVVDFTELEGVTWTNKNRPNRSTSTRLSQSRVSKILFSRSHSTGHCVVQPVENLHRFTLRLPEEVRKQLTKSVEVAQAKSLRRDYRSRSAGSERNVFSYRRNDYNNRRVQHSMSFSFSDCARCNSTGEDAVVPSTSLQPFDHVQEQV